MPLTLNHIIMNIVMEFSLRIEIVKLNNFEVQFFGVIPVFCFQVPFPGLSEYERST